VLPYNSRAGRASFGRVLDCLGQLNEREAQRVEQRLCDDVAARIVVREPRPHALTNVVKASVDGSLSLLSMYSEKLRAIECQRSQSGITGGVRTHMLTAMRGGAE
jgi:hypothetical protein